MQPNNFGNNNNQFGNFAQFGNQGQTHPTYSFAPETVLQPTIETVLGEVERSYYNGLWADVAGVDAEIIEQSRISSKFIPLSTSSGLEKKLLGQIWRKTTATGTLTRLEFFKYLRYIAIYQNNIEESRHDEYLMDMRFPLLPKFEGIHLPEVNAILPKGLAPPQPSIAYPNISHQELLDYENTIQLTKTKALGTLDATEAAIVLTASGLEKSDLKKIWQISVSAAGHQEQKSFLRKSEWIIALHLIKKKLIGYPIPESLTPDLNQFVIQYEQQMLQQTQGFESNTSGSNSLPQNFPQPQQAEKQASEEKQGGLIFGNQSIPPVQFGSIPQAQNVVNQVPIQVNPNFYQNQDAFLQTAQTGFSGQNGPVSNTINSGVPTYGQGTIPVLNANVSSQHTQVNQQNIPYEAPKVAPVVNQPINVITGNVQNVSNSPQVQNTQEIDKKVLESVEQNLGSVEDVFSYIKNVSNDLTYLSTAQAERVKLNQAEFDKQEQEKQKLIDEALTLIDSLNMYSQEISNNLTSLKEIVENQKRIFRDDPEVTNACKEFNLLLKEKSLQDNAKVYLKNIDNMIARFKENSKAESVMSESLERAVVFPEANGKKTQRSINNPVFPGHNDIGSVAGLSKQSSGAQKLDEDKQFKHNMGMDLENENPDDFFDSNPTNQKTFMPGWI